jgi:hypothetical protein
MAKSAMNDLVYFRDGGFPAVFKGESHMKGSELVALREAVGLNCSQAAEFLGVDRTPLIRWERSDDIPRLAAAGTSTLLVRDAELDAWVATLKPAARRGIAARCAEWDEKHAAHAVKPHELPPLPVGNWPVNCQECTLSLQRRTSDCAGCPNYGARDPLRENPATECGGILRGGPDPVAEFRRDAAPLQECHNPAGDAGVPQPGRSQVDLEGSVQMSGDGPHNDLAPDGNPAVAGEQVEKLRKILKVKLAQFGGKGIRDLYGKTGILPEYLLQFVQEDGLISINQVDAIMEVLRESESA